MYILEPVSHITIWGGTKLSKYAVDGSESLGHLYMANGHREMSNVILNGIYGGKTLREVFAIEKEAWNMNEYKEFPLTIALVDAAENLSIQVHPDEAAAELIEHEKIGKTESWLFFDPPKAGWIYAGCRCDTKEEVETAVANGEMEQITQHLEIARDSYVCVKAGTLHAMTAGSFVYEIEYGSNYTYRFYDYKRKDADGNTRELHIDKALKSIHPGITLTAMQAYDDIWISEKTYEICRKREIDRYKNNSNMLECVSIIDGSGYCDECEIRSGMTIILLPGEELENMELNTIIIARTKKTDEETN